MPYLTAAQIESEMTSLANPVPGAPVLCTKIALPNPTVSEGAGPTTYSYLKIANGSGAGRVAVLAVAGMHAREWAQPDSVISFARRLLAAYRGNNAFVIPAYTDMAGSTHGLVSVPAPTIRRMVDELDILLVPCANPDGRAFSQADVANTDWRKNRAPRPAGGAAETVGVDLNRNFDIAWDYGVYYNAAFAATAGTNLSASKDPADERFIGRAQPAPNATHPASEPEVRNLIWILDHHPVTYSVDLHSYSPGSSGLAMHSWGIERNGSIANQNFRDPALDGTRDGTLGTAYAEYFPNTPPTYLLDQHTRIVGAIQARVRAATGRTYTPGGIADRVYPATGLLTDFHFSRQFTIAGSPPIYAFAIEFGDSDDHFQPKYDDPHRFPKIEREVHAALLVLLETALPTPAAGGTGGGTGSGTKWCIITIAVTQFAAGNGWLQTLRDGRTAFLSCERTRDAMVTIDDAYRSLSASIGPHVVERRWAQRAIAYGLVAPAAAITRVALKWRSQ